MNSAASPSFTLAAAERSEPVKPSKEYRVSDKAFATFILLANPSTTTAAQVRVTYLRSNGAAPLVRASRDSA